MTLLADRRMTLSETLRAQGRILFALMLRDVRTRFFGSAFGALIAIAWPLSHVFILLGIYTLLGRAAPYGENAALFFATGVTPFMAFNYMSRFTSMGIALNRPLLGFPVVKITDILFARAILEVMNAAIVVLATMLIFAILGIGFMPEDKIQAFCALGASMLLGLGFGVVNGVIAGIFPLWLTGSVLFTIIMWVSSGVLFVPDALPETAQYWLSFNPMLVGIEWMRSAYYEGYGQGLLFKYYMVSFALVTLFLGLLLERLLRKRIRE